MHPTDLARKAILHVLLSNGPSVRDRLVGAPPTNDRGARLDADSWLLASLERRFGHGITAHDPLAARASMRRSIPLVASRPLPCATSPLTLAGRPARRYASTPDAPVLLYLHGGGWVTGDLDTHDALCRRLCVDGGWTVVALDWRLAPEHPFPAGLDDAVAAVRQLRADPARSGDGRVAIGGDSAGGNLAAAACQVLRDAGETVPDLQLLIYPGLDQRRVAPSHQRFARGFLLDAAGMDAYQAHYAMPLTDPRASPLLASSFAGLPPAVITTAGFDPLRDEGEAYVARLREAGVAVVHLDAAAQLHGYAQLDGISADADREVRRITDTLRRVRDRG